MAGRILNSSILKIACAVLPACAFLALCMGAYGQEPNRSDCVTHFHDGKPYVFCKSKKTFRRYSAPPAASKPPAAARKTVAPTIAPAPSAPSAPAAKRARDFGTGEGAARGGGAGPAAGARKNGEGAGRTGAGSPPAARPGAPVVGRPAAGPTAARLRAVRALIEPAEMPPREVAGYGIVAFTTRALPIDIERYKSVCEAYKATLMSQAELPPNTPLSEQMVTYWPIANKNTPEAQRADCPHLVSNYALRLGLDAIQDADKQKEGLASRRGPFLIAWAPSESRFVPDALVLVIDLSALDGQRSFTEVFQDWRQHITDNPELWRSGGFSVESVRRIIRDTFDRYGDGLMRLINTKT
jgi:hypothetical protein